MGVALCLFLETIHTRIDFVMILREPTHTFVPLGILRLPEAPLPGRPQITYRDLGILHSRCDQLSLALVESCWGGCSPVIASPRVSPPSDALSSTSRFVIPQDCHRQSDASSDLALAVAFQGALSRTIRSWRRSCDYRRLRSRESPSPLQVGVAFKGFPLSILNEPQGLPLSSANGFASWGSPSPKRMGFASWRSPPPPPYPGGPLLQVNEIHLKGLPLSSANGIRFRGVPFSKANGIRLLGVPPYPGGSLLQVNEIHLKGLPLSITNGIHFRGVPFSKENGICLKGVPLSNANESRLKGFPPLQCEWDSLQGGPLSTATVFRFNEPYFISTSALIPCFI